MLERPQLQFVSSRIIEDRKFIQVLVGPRQTGKTTLGYSARLAENKGMTVFAEKFKPTKVMLVGTGGMPIEDFLKTNLFDMF